MKKMAIKGLVALAAVVALCMFFSGTIRTNKSITVTFCELNVNIFKKSLLTDSKCYVVSTNH